jgi:hypothetical protein
MNPPSNVKTGRAAGPLFAALVFFLLLVLSMWGAIPMFVGSIIALATHLFLFRDQWRGRHWLRLLVPVLVTALVGAAIGFALSRGPSH